MITVILAAIGVGVSLAVVLMLWGMAAAAKRADEQLGKINGKKLE